MVQRFLGSDIEIAQAIFPHHALKIDEVAQKAGIPPEYVEPHGKYKAKIDYNFLLKDESGPRGKLVLVTAITPTPAGEGKTTTTVGLADSLARIGKKAMAALREPSLGPVFGVKGGAAGGGWAQLLPMEEINLHFTGDSHAIAAATNLLAAVIDNHIFQGNKLRIDPRKIVWRRCVDMNDRQLRFIINGLGGTSNGTPREDGYDITAASEVMAILCLASGIEDLKERLGRIIVGYDTDDQAVTAAQLNTQGAMAVLLKEALKPNLVQTLEGTPAFVHGGPFANIAHGCNSIMATRMALKCADYVVTEAGFGADLGAEKFLGIKCRYGGLLPSAVVIVATIRALKFHGGARRRDMDKENLEALTRGLPNLLQHVENITQVYKLPAVVAINAFSHDTSASYFPAEFKLIQEGCEKLGVKVLISEVWARGSEGGEELAQELVRLCDEKSRFQHAYDPQMPIKDKIEAIAKRIYRAEAVNILPAVQKKIEQLEHMGLDKVPICMAKTQSSFSDDPLKRGVPRGWVLTVRDIKISAGAGFIVVFTGEIMTMPGLPPVPAVDKIDIDRDGVISGIF